MKTEQRGAKGLPAEDAGRPQTPRETWGRVPSRTGLASASSLGDGENSWCLSAVWAALLGNECRSLCALQWLRPLPRPGWSMETHQVPRRPLRAQGG